MFQTFRHLRPIVSRQGRLSCAISAQSLSSVAPKIITEKKAKVIQPKVPQEPVVPVEPQTISKVLADTGICSRAEAEKLVGQKRVTINGDVVLSSTYKFVMTPSVSLELDGVRLKNKYAIEHPVRMWAIKKKTYELMSDHDSDKGRELVINRFLKMLPPTDVQENKATGFKPLYRMEYLTEGLCFYTNSSEFAKMMDSASETFGKHYRLRVHGLITDSKLQGLRTGLFIDGIKYKPMEVNVETKAGTISWVNITCYDNKSQAIKKSFEKLFLKITRSMCTGFGPYQLESIIPTDSKIHCREVKLTPEMNAMYIKMQNNRKGLLYKTKVTKDLTSGNSSNNNNGGGGGSKKKDDAAGFKLSF